MTTGPIRRVNTAADGTQANHRSAGGNLSADGRYVAFSSRADNLVPGDGNGLSDVFVVNLDTGQIIRANTAADGTPTEVFAGYYGGTAGDSFGGHLSADGRHVAFSSTAANLVPGDGNLLTDLRSGEDVFVKDLKTGEIVLASADAHGNQTVLGANGSENFDAMLSGDGGAVIFVSKDFAYLSPGQTNPGDTYVKDLGTGALVNHGEINGRHWHDFHTPSLTSDGRYLAFSSTDPNLVDGDTNLAEGCEWDLVLSCEKWGEDIFVEDRITGTLVLVSDTADGTQGNNDSKDPILSADGRYVAFRSLADNLVGGDTNGTWDTFVKNLETGDIVRASIAADGTEADGDSTGAALLSADGRYLVFESEASNLVEGDTNGIEDIFLKDLQTGVIARVNTAADGTQSNRGSDWFSVSADGRTVAFLSDATNLVTGDTNGYADVFVKDLSDVFAGEATTGTAAAESLAGTAFDDTIAGLGGDDTLDGLGGNDSLLGDAGADLLFGGDGQDTLVGGAGNDTLVDTSGHDHLQGGDGRDSITAGVGDDIYDGGGARDILSYRGLNDGVIVDLVAGTASALSTGNDTIIDIERVFGGNGDDTFSGDENRNQFDGLDGDDSFRADGGNDAYRGGNGDDTLSFEDATQGVRVDLADGTASGPQTGQDTIGGVENVVGGSGDDTLIGDDNDNMFEAGGGDDRLYADAGNDTYRGGDGDDTAVFASPLDRYTITILGGTSLTTTFVGAEGIDEGSDLLTDVEFFSFGGTTYSFADLAPPLGAVTFETDAVSSYDVAQDVTGTFEVADDGSSLHLTGNTWKKIPFSYEVSADTAIELDFRSSEEGEVQGIGFDDDDTFSADRFFQFYGNQDNNKWHRQFDTYDGGDWVHYRINVGEFFTGSMDYLTFANDHDVSVPTAEAQFRDVRVFEDPTDKVVDDSVTFAADAVRSFDPAQDITGTFAVLDEGATLQLAGNTWKKIPFFYNVTADTVIELDFRSAVEGEVQGIGFDDDDTFSPDWFFQLYGNQDNNKWHREFDTYGGDDWIHYRIDVGQFFTGYMDYLVFANDHDVGSPTAESRFRDVRVFEDPTERVGDNSVTFASGAVSSYDVAQDTTGTYAVVDDGSTLQLAGNTWKKIPFFQNVTADTVLEFDFRSPAQGEIQGIGFDNDDRFSPEWFFELYGTQDSDTWHREFDTYSGGEWVHYHIEVGQFFSGFMDYMTFVNDHDVTVPTAEAQFRNVEVYENAGSDLLA